MESIHLGRLDGDHCFLEKFPSNGFSNRYFKMETQNSKSEAFNGIDESIECPCSKHVALLCEITDHELIRSITP